MKFTQTLKFKMPFTIILSIAVMLIILMIVIISTSAAFIERTALRGFSETADGYRDLVSVWLNDQIDLTSIIAKESEFLDYFKEPNEHNLTIAENELDELLVELEMHFSSFSLFDLNGRLIKSTYNNQNALESDISHRRLWQRLIDSGYRYSIDDEIEISLINNEYVITLLSGVFDNNGEPVGILAAELKWNNFAKKYFSEITIGKTGNIYVVDEEGKRVAHRDISKINTVSMGSKNALSAAASQRKGVLHYEDDGEKVMAFSRLDNINWIMCVTMLDSEFYSDRNTLIIITIILSILLLLITSLIVILYVNKNMVDSV